MAEDNMKNKESSILLGIIPARGGSKGIKNKNLRKVLTKPLIYYTIKDALSYNEIYKTIVTTDSLEIAEVAKKYGAEVPFLRPKSISKADSTEMEFFEHALNWFLSTKIDSTLFLIKISDPSKSPFLPSFIIIL